MTARSPLKIAMQVLRKLSERDRWIERVDWRTAYLASRETMRYPREKLSFSSVEGHAIRKGLIRVEGSLITLIHPGS